MLTKTVVLPAQCPQPLGPYNHAVKAGNFLFCSGQIPLDPATGQMISSTKIEDQTERVLENILLILAHEHLSFQHVVKTTVFMVDLNDFGAMNTVYGRYFSTDFPARSTVQVAALPKNSKIEIEIIAIIPD